MILVGSMCFYTALAGVLITAIIFKPHYLIIEVLFGLIIPSSMFQVAVAYYQANGYWRGPEANIGTNWKKYLIIGTSLILVPHAILLAAPGTGVIFHAGKLAAALTYPGIMCLIWSATNFLSFKIKEDSN